MHQTRYPATGIRFGDSERRLEKEAILILPIIPQLFVKINKNVYNFQLSS